MRSRVFSLDYASLYDTVYASKNYKAEVERVLSWVPEKVGAESPLNILDLGCGTGKHALELAKLRHKVICLDQSVSMLEHAKRRFAECGLQFQGYEASIQNFQLDGKFELVTMMFAVLNYVVDQGDLRSAFKRIRAHLVDGGVFIFDAWHGPGVELLRPSIRTKEFMFAGESVKRVSTGEIDMGKNLVNVKIKMNLVNNDKMESVVADETHLLRYFFPDELKVMMRECQLDLRVVEDFDEPGRNANNQSWNMFCVAVAV